MKLHISTLLAVAGILGCGDDGGAGTADAPNVPAMVAVSGTASARSATGSMPLANVTVGAYRNGDDATAVATTMTDASGNYTLMIPTMGRPLEGYVKGTLATYMDTYLYPPRPVIADFAGASLNMLTPNTFMLLSETLCSAGQEAGKGTVAVIVADGDAARTPIAGATVSSSPAATKYCYNMGGLPNRMATMTDTDGTAYMFNVTGEVTVSASKSGTTFLSHKVTARAGALTTTLIQP
jgi:hypothetical protein